MRCLITLSDVTISVGDDELGHLTNRVLSGQVKSQVFLLERWMSSFQRLSPFGSPSPNFQMVAGGFVNLKLVWGL
jgi:hypothetical protein